MTTHMLSTEEQLSSMACLPCNAKGGDLDLLPAELIKKVNIDTDHTILCPLPFSEVQNSNIPILEAC
jgi:hypothetical protein